jgi:hypothetical protein
LELEDEKGERGSLGFQT